MHLLRLKSNLLPTLYRNQKKFGSYAARAYNKVDQNRLNLVGPDRLCAEWILKNGGAVAFSVKPNNFLSDYKALPPEKTKLSIVSIDGSNSSIMRSGFDHLIGCKQIERMVIHNCNDLEDDGLEGLIHIKSILRHLQVSNCINITDDGLFPLRSLYALKTLKICNMKNVRRLGMIVHDLESCLRNCQITSM